MLLMDLTVNLFCLTLYFLCFISLYSMDYFSEFLCVLFLFKSVFLCVFSLLRHLQGFVSTHIQHFTIYSEICIVFRWLNKKKKTFVWVNQAV